LVSGVSVQVSGSVFAVLTPEILYEIRLAGTVNRLNLEHRTPNIERPILMTLRFIDFTTSELQNFDGLIRVPSLFFK
jgi:hypothetical protein